MGVKGQYDHRNISYDFCIGGQERVKWYRALSGTFLPIKDIIPLKDTY